MGALSAVALSAVAELVKFACKFTINLHYEHLYYKSWTVSVCLTVEYACGRAQRVGERSEGLSPKKTPNLSGAIAPGRLV